MLWKRYTQYASTFGKRGSGHRTGKGQYSFQSQRKAMPKNAQTTTQLHSSHMLVDWATLLSLFILITKKDNAKECSNYLTIALISHTSKVMLKILQARLQQYVNHELPDVQAGFRKGRGTRDQIANLHWIMEKTKEFQKTSISALLTMPKPLTVWITINCGQFWKRWEYQTTWPASWETCM